MSELQPADSPAQRAIAWLGTQHEAMLQLIGELVSIDSGSGHDSGVDAVGRRLERFFAEHEVPVQWHRGSADGDAFSAGLSLDADQRGHVLLMGHRDTVFPVGEAARRPFRIEGGRAYGPGVADMKPGLVMNAFVLVACRRFSAVPFPVCALFTTDEEIASPRSRQIITRAARGARAVFNAEPGRANGNVVTGRKGGTFLSLSIQGRAAHSGANFADGISAIDELAYKIVALRQITDMERGLTLNVGTVHGGQTVNTVAPSVRAQIDLRYRTQADRNEAIARIEAIVNQATVAGTSASLAIDGEFDSFSQSAESVRLFELYRQAMADLGVVVNGEFSGGCADSGITSNLGIPTLCATGPVGGGYHTPEEYLVINSVVPRTQGLMLAISRLDGQF